jgi:hypothetical protein
MGQTVRSGPGNDLPKGPSTNPVSLFVVGSWDGVARGKLVLLGPETTCPVGKPILKTKCCAAC